MKETVIDAVIPVYCPGPELAELIRRLRLQRTAIRTIYLMHTKDGSNLRDAEYFRDDGSMIIEEIEPEEFDHGGTRDAGIRKSDADYVLCMTQDAVPADSRLTERLLGGFGDPHTAAVYARQLPRKDCGLLECYTRSFNYPDHDILKSGQDLERMGIKTYFCSNVCAMYRRETYLEQGGFEKKIIFSEDMIYAAGCVRSGYKIYYASGARVIHSHNYTNRQQFHRNFDLAVSQAQHAEIFRDVKSESEGIRMVWETALWLIKVKRPWLILSLVTASGAKYLGYLMGKNYRRLPRWLVLKCTMSPRYWGGNRKKSRKHIEIFREIR